MIIEEATQLALELMDKHGLIEKGWVFKYDSSLKRFGCCWHRKQMITLSSKLCQLNSKERVQNTALHEIAHALVGYKHGHDMVWKMKAIEIGCDGKRCYGKDVITPKARYIAVCPVCGHIHLLNRIPKRRQSCGACSRVFKEDRILTFKHND